MIDRYTTSAMSQIWSLENQYNTWLAVETAVVAGWESIGKVPAVDLEKIRANASFTVERVVEIEQTTEHDVVAFTRAVSESLGDERKWIHYGLTSTDVVDTAQALRLRQASQLIQTDFAALIDQLKQMILQYKDTPMIGRTHGVHAEVTTFGLKLARHYQALQRNLERFNHAAKALEVGKLAGAVGTFANISPEVEQVAMQELDLQPLAIGSQVLPRDLHAEYIASMALVGCSLEELATELRSLQRTEIREVEEGFAPGQKGSSAMPHKRNPIGSENVTGLARVLRGYVTPALEDITLWHERDISHSSVERIILPDATSLLDYALKRMLMILQRLNVFPERMLENIRLTHGLVYSQQILNALINTGLSRETSYDLVQPIAMTAWDQQVDFKTLVEENSEIAEHLTAEQIQATFDYRRQLTHVDDILKRAGIL